MSAADKAAEEVQFVLMGSTFVEEFPDSAKEQRDRIARIIGRHIPNMPASRYPNCAALNHALAQDGFVAVHVERDMWEALARKLEESEAALLEALKETLMCLRAWSVGRGPNDATTDVVNRASAALSQAQPEEAAGES